MARRSARRPSLCRSAGDALWLPNTTRPAWLDGSLPGDRGFDPLGLSKPVEYLQVDVSVTQADTAAVVVRQPHCQRGPTLQAGVVLCQTSLIAVAFMCTHSRKCLGAINAPAFDLAQRGAPDGHAACTQLGFTGSNTASLPPLLSSGQLDELDQNAAVNKAGNVIGAFTPVADQVSTDSLQPYRSAWQQSGGVCSQSQLSASARVPSLSLASYSCAFSSCHRLSVRATFLGFHSLFPPPCLCRAAARCSACSASVSAS